MTFTQKLLIHGGAGTIPKELHKDYHRGAIEALKTGWEVMEHTSNSLSAVEASVQAMEDYPLFNAGYGSVMTEKGTIEMDALIVDGSNMRIGGLIGVSHVKNPISASKVILENLPHHLLFGLQAEEYLQTQGVELVPQETLITQRSRDRLTKYLVEKKSYGDYIEPSKDPERRGKYGTVGAVALDSQGRLSAATSTGGVLGKLPGRVGDTPLFGTGTYADDEIAVSATGIGEKIIEYVLAMKIKFYISQTQSAEVATKLALEEMKNKVEGYAGVIVMTKDFGFSAMKSTKDLVYAFKSQDGDTGDFLSEKK